ncbi:hypothetical protein ACFLXC_04210 [Chloroflexota bacterium]
MPSLDLPYHPQLTGGYHNRIEWLQPTLSSSRAESGFRPPCYETGH